MPTVKGISVEEIRQAVDAHCRRHYRTRRGVLFCKKCGTKIQTLTGKTTIDPDGDEEESFPLPYCPNCDHHADDAPFN